MSDDLAPHFPPWSDDLHELRCPFTDEPGDLRCRLAPHPPEIPHKFYETGHEPEDYHELTHAEITEWVHMQLVFGVTAATAGQIATQVQAWQVEQRASYQLTISRLQLELQQERGQRGHSAVDLERAVEGIREILEEFWPRST